jgi:hypothetical protein
MSTILAIAAFITCALAARAGAASRVRVATIAARIRRP